MAVISSLSLIILLTLTSASTTADTFNVDSLLVQSLGGEEALLRITSVKTITSEGLISLNSQLGNFRQFYKAPNRMRLEVDFGAFKIIQGFDGTTAWQTDLTGRTSELHGFERDEVIKNLFFESVSYLRSDRTSDSFEYNGIDTIDGTPYHVVEFYPLLTDTILAYYSLSDSSKYSIVDYVDNLQVVTTLYDHEPVEKVLIPFRTTAQIKDAGMMTELVVESYSYDLPIDDSLFAIPINSNENYYFPEYSDSVLLPVDYIGGHLRLRAKLNGKEMWFILDSGASATLLNRTSVAELGLKKVGALPARGVSGFTEVDLVRLDSLNIGDITLYDVRAGVLDLSRLDRKVPVTGTFGGLIGYDFLSKLPLVIDYEREQIIAFRPESFVQPTSAPAIDFVLSMQVPTLEASINGHTGKFLIDLGNALGLVVHHGFVKEVNLLASLSDLQESSKRFFGITGSMTARTGLSDSVKIGHIRLDSLRLVLPDSASGVSGSEEISGNFGNMVLENFQVILDYSAGKIWLLPPTSR